MNQSNLFDRKLLKANRARAKKHFYDHNFLYVEVANKIMENIQFFDREFESVLEISGRDGYLSDQIKLIKKPKKIITTEILNYDKSTQVINDDEFLPFKKESFDLIVSNLNFHFINNIPSFLLQIKEMLKPNGVFIATFFGEENLSELAHVLYEVENELYGGMSPRMSPTIDVKTAAHLLQKAGFRNPISDFEKIEVTYENPLNLLKDIKMMGQANILFSRSKNFISKRFLAKFCDSYSRLYCLDNFDGKARLKASFEIITLTGWK